MAHVEVRLSIDDGAEDQPLAVISGIAKGVRNIESVLRDAVADARRRGHTWQEIADALEVSRQSAWERFKDEEMSRKDVIKQVLGSLKLPPGGPTLEEIRAEEREADYEREVRKWGSSPPGTKWRS